MKVLFLSPDQNPFEYRTGSSQRTNLLLKACIKFAEVDVFTFDYALSHDKVVLPPNCKLITIHKSVSEPKEKSRFEKWKPVLIYWKTHNFFFFDKTNSSCLKEHINFNQYDRIVIRYLSKAIEYGLLDFKEKLIVDVDDMPYDQYKVLTIGAETFSSKLRNFVLSMKSKYLTKRILNEIRYSFLSNPEQLLNKKTVYLPNIPFYQDIECNEVDFSKQSKRIIFIGELGYSPNKKGLDYFLKNIYTEVQKKMPDVELLIGGKVWDPNLKIKWEKYSNVSLLGYVEDIKEFYEKSRVFIIPIYTGGGTNIKLLESAQMKRACVTTKIGFRGFGNYFENGRDLFVANSDKEFVDMLFELLTNEDTNKLLSLNAYNVVNKHFNKKRFNAIVKETLQK
jgi:glycosyltransferase involved in cell wall biosynthesis